MAGATQSRLPTALILEVVTPEGLLLREEVDDVVARGAAGYLGVRPGHTPFFSTLGMGEISYSRRGERRRLTCFWGFWEVLPDRVSILAEAGERAEDIDPEQAERDKTRALEQMRRIKDEVG